MSKKGITIIFSAIVLATVFGCIIPATKVKAVSGDFAQRLANRASAAAEKQDDQLSKIIARGDQMIQQRITTLQTLLTRVQNDSKLSSDEKTSFANDINTTITNLQTLKTKLDADTDVATARNDTKSIVTSYRIYLIFEPKERLSVIIDNVSTASGNLSSLVTQVQNLLNTLKSEGKDTTTAQNALNDISTQLTNINTILTTDTNLLSGVSVGTSNPQSVFTQVRKDLATVRQDLAKIRSDFATIKTSFNGLFKTTTPTVTPSPTQ